MDFRIDTIFRNKILLLPEQDFSIKQFDVFDELGALSSRYHGIEYRTADGVPYPSRATYSIYGSGGASDLIKESRFEVLSITLNRDDIPDSLFEVDIPKDADVYDLDEGKYLRNPGKIQAVLDEIARESPRRRSGQFWAWIGAALGGATLIAVALSVWRVLRGRATRTTRPSGND